MTLELYLNSHGYYDNLYDELNHMKSKNDEEKLFVLELYEIKRLILPSLASCDVASLSSMDFLKIYNRMRRSNYSEESVRRLHTVLSDLFDDMEKNGVIVDNPLRYFYIEKLRSMPDYYLTPSELEKLLSQLSLSYNLNIYRFSLYSGLRLSIALALSPSDIDWESGLVSTEKLITMNYENFRYEVETNIAEWNMRKFYLSRKALKVLSNEIERRKEKNIKSQDDLIFYKDDGSYISPENIRCECRQLCKNTEAALLYKQFEIGSYEDLKEGKEDERA